MELKIKITKETASALEELTNEGENVQQLGARFLKDLAEVPRAEVTDGFRALLGPAWLHDLGTDFDREVSLKHFDNGTPSYVAKVSSIRNTLGIKSRRRQGKPRKYNDEGRKETWAAMKTLKVSNTVVMGSLGFRKAADCVEWAEANGVKDLVERLATVVKKS